MKRTYPAKTFSFWGTFKKYFKRTCKIYGYLLSVPSIISFIQLFSSNSFFLSFLFLKTIGKSLSNNVLNMFVNIIVSAIFLFPAIIILLVIIIFIYFLIIVFRQASSYNAVYEGNNLLKKKQKIKPNKKQILMLTKFFRSCKRII